MAVALRSYGSVAESNTFNTDLTPGDPAGLTTGDVQILIELLSGFGTNAALPTLKALTTGWTEIVDTGTVGPATNNRIARLRVSWALHDATDPISDTNTDGANMGGTPTATNYLARAVRLAFSGVDLTKPIDVSRTNAADSPAVTTAFTMNGVTTTVDNAMVVQIMGISDDNTVSGQAYANGPAVLSEDIESTSPTGGDNAIVVTTGTLATAGATGAFSATASGDDMTAGAIIALNPSGGAPHAPASVSASATGTTTATTGATMPADSDVTLYRVRRKSGSGQSFSDHTDGTAVATDVATTPSAVVSGVSVTGLSAATAYTIGWFAGDSGGNYSAAGTANVTTTAATTSRKHAIRSIVARRRRR